MLLKMFLFLKITCFVCFVVIESLQSIFVIILYKNTYLEHFNLFFKIQDLWLNLYRSN